MDSLMDKLLNDLQFGPIQLPRPSREQMLEWAEDDDVIPYNLYDWSRE